MQFDAEERQVEDIPCSGLPLNSHLPLKGITFEAAIGRVFDAARAQASSSAYLRGSFGELEQDATLHIERYGYIEDRIIFECGSLSPCTIRLGDGYIELIKPGVINEHIVRYLHVAAH